MRTTTVIIGAGHCGLAMSKCLADRSIDHVVLERGEVANSWKKDRWKSLRLLTPNWQSRLPGHDYAGDDPDGYRTLPEIVEFIEGYAALIEAPVQEQTTVESVRATADGYEILTDNGPWRCRTVVLASGECNVPSVPSVARELPSGIVSLTPNRYEGAERLPDGGVLVVGASATGVQLADEIRKSGRPVTVAVGEHVRMPRVYRGRDIEWWLDAAGVMDDFYTDEENLERARSLPSAQLIGCPDRRMVDLNFLTASGVKLVGRLAGMRDGTALFSGSLRNVYTLADRKMHRLLDRIDEWAEQSGVAGEVGPPGRYEPTRVDESPTLQIDLERQGIRTVLWATGFRPDYSWLDVPVLDRKGRIRHDGGVVEAPGMYLLGTQFLRRRKSSFIDGAGDDARDLADHLVGYLAAPGA